MPDTTLRFRVKPVGLALALAVLGATLAGAAVLAPPPARAAAGPGEERLLANVRQLTFAGRRAGEGYFSRDGAMMIFQSEREPGNPFYQIYLMDLETGDTRRMSPGVGKTTCAWIHPDGERVLFASTHEDPAARDKQREEIEKRAAGTSRRYAWSFDENYDIYEADIATGRLRNLTGARGYDAEGSWSPDGTRIVFASNRRAYAAPLSERDQGILARDASYFMDLYIMDADGGGLRRLTDAPGYDGGPFFSADGSKIVWRRFAEDGATAEIFIMDSDGGGARQVTRLGAMSWAPYFHLSVDYLIFATNLQGFGNFDLYLIDVAGRAEPVRVTFTQGFDGLPVFSPDGTKLSWTSARTPDKSAQIFLAEWDDAAARRLLGLAGAAATGTRGGVAAPRPGPGPVPAVPDTGPAIRAGDLRRHITTLASEEMEGRLTGTAGERLATEYVASVFKSIGLAPAGDDGSYFQAFTFPAGVALGPDNRLALGRGDGGAARSLVLDTDWRPLAFSRTGTVPASAVAFAGYGIIAPGGDGFAPYDSYGALEVRDKWVLVFRYLPEGLSPETRQHLNHYADLQYKASVARERGARGLLVASGPNSRVKADLVPLSFEVASASGALPAVSISDRIAAGLLEGAGKKLAELQSALDSGAAVPGFAVPGAALAAVIDIAQESRTGRNVLARLNAGERPGPTAAVIGAHVDHLGHGIPGKSLAGGDEIGQIHFGADDNASGVAGMLEIAERLAADKAAGRLDLSHDLLFAAWSGEELGVLGSTYFTRTFGGGGRESLRPDIIAYLNLDMIGRLDDGLTLFGVGSSSRWRGEIERRNVPVGLSIVTSEESYLPTDALPFYLKGVPILSAFSGAHGDYHSPRDTADKLNYRGAERIARLMALLARAVATRAEAPDFIRTERTGESLRRRTSRITLGTIPDYAGSGGGGLAIAGLAKGGPAEKAGLRPGDVVVELAGRAIANIYDYSYALDALKAGEPVAVVVERDGARVSLTITPQSRE